MTTWLSQHLVELLIATLLGVIAWSIRRFVAAVDSHGERIAALERDQVTRDQIDELRHSLMATLTQNHERTEQRLDRLLERSREVQ